MPDTMLHLLAVLASLAGMGWLALAMDAHWEQAFGTPAPSPRQRQGLRLVGGLGLFVSLILCLAVDHPSMAALVWIMVLAAAALAIAFTLAWRARWLRLLLPTAG